MCETQIVLQVTDVPGLSDTHLSEKTVLKETAKSVALVTPGPHVILFVISGGRRFTKVPVILCTIVLITIIIIIFILFLYFASF